jgi:hypothetical protein
MDLFGCGACFGFLFHAWSLLSVRNLFCELGYGDVLFSFKILGNRAIPPVSGAFSRGSLAARLACPMIEGLFAYCFFCSIPRAVIVIHSVACEAELLPSAFPMHRLARLWDNPCADLAIAYPMASNFTVVEALGHQVKFERRVFLREDAHEWQQLEIARVELVSEFRTHA